MPDDVTIMPLGPFQETIGSQCNPFLTVRVSNADVAREPHFFVTGIGNGIPHERVVSTIAYLRHLHGIASSAGTQALEGSDIVFQGEDVPIDVPSVSWETMKGWQHVRLVPDIYYFHAGGYEDFTPPDIAWRDRSSTIVWRGSTTGLFHQHVDDLDALPRYRLCRIATELGAIADVGFTAAVQAANPEQGRRIGDRLAHEGLLKGFIPTPEMTAYRYIVDIDGNSNSWNFMMKLRLGCCVLRVESDWRQWFSDRLHAWEHYIPVARDLDDLAETLAWCLDNEAECAAIAVRGAVFARTMMFADEMANAANTVYGAHRIP